MALASVAVGTVLSGLAIVAGVSPGSALVPLALGMVVAFAIVPFPAADYLLAFGTLLSIPLLPSFGLPNLPLGLAAVGIACVRIVPGIRRVPHRVLVTITLIWLPLVIGVALSDWPPPSMWLRPVVLLSAGAGMTVVGAVVATDHGRLMRWLTGWTVAALVVASTAATVFLLQFFVPVTSIADGMTNLLAYIRGEGAGRSFGAVNNWIIAGPDALTLRAVSPFMPAPTNVGGYLGILGPVALFILLVAASQPARRLAAVTVAAATFVIVATFSRSTWVASAAMLAVGGLAIALPRIRSAAWWPDRRGFMVLAGILLIPAALSLVLVAAVGQPATSTRVEQPMDDPSVQVRLEIDKGAVTAIQRSPLVGNGLGNWEATLGTNDGVSYIHNVYLEYAAAAGLLGLVWVIAVLLGIILPGLRLLIRGSPGSTSIALVLVLVGVFAATQFLFDDNLLNPQYAWALMFTLGVALTVGLSNSSLRSFPAVETT